MGKRDRTETIVLVAFWVLPLLVVAGLLVAVGLPFIAGALLAVELLVAGVVAVARRCPARPASPSRPWLVPVTMLGVLVGLVGVTVLAARLG